MKRGSKIFKNIQILLILAPNGSHRRVQSSNPSFEGRWVKREFYRVTQSVANESAMRTKWQNHEKWPILTNLYYIYG